MKKMTVSGKTIDLRSDHLKAVIVYALQQATDSGIEVLDFAANDQALDHSEQCDYLEQLLQALNSITTGSSQELLLVAADQESIDSYYDCKL